MFAFITCFAVRCKQSTCTQMLLGKHQVFYTGGTNAQFTETKKAELFPAISCWTAG